MTLCHYTITTGHVRQSPRSEVADDVIVALHPLLRTGDHRMPGPHGYRLRVTVDGTDRRHAVRAHRLRPDPDRRRARQLPPRGGGALVSRSIEVTPYPTVTDAQIRQLADEAGWHADYAMSAICDIALGGDGVDRRMDDAQRAIVACFRTRRGLPRQAAARRECARVIAEAVRS